jgi:hypothetical protein
VETTTLPNDPKKRKAYCENISDRQKGEQNPRFGKSHSTKTRKHLSETWGTGQRISKKIQRSTPRYFRIEKVLTEFAEENRPNFTAGDVSNRAKLTCPETAHILRFTNGVERITRPGAGTGVYIFTGEPIKVVV